MAKGTWTQIGLSRQIYANTASNALQIQEVFPAAFSLSWQKFALLKLLGTFSVDIFEWFWCGGRRFAGAKWGRQAKKSRKYHRKGGSGSSTLCHTKKKRSDHMNRPKHNLTALTWTRFKRRYFAAFHLIGLVGRQPIFALCGKNRLKSHSLKSCGVYFVQIYVETRKMP